MKIIQSIIAVCLVYLAGAFNGASFDISQWASDERMLVAIWMLVAFVVTYTFPRDL